MHCGSEGIGAVVQSCGGCGGRAPEKRWHLMDRIPAATRAQQGQEVQVKLDGIPARDRNGRHAHVTAFKIQGDLSFTLAAANDQMDGYDMLASYRNMFLRDVSGWIYWSGNDMRALRDDVFFRNFRTPTTSPLPTTINVNAGAGGITRTTDQYLPLSRIDDEEGNGIVKGSIPLAALQARGNDAFVFTPSTALGSAAYAGITQNGFTGTLKVWAQVIYLEALVIDAPWMVETYTLAETSGQLRHPSAEHEYLALRHFPEDTGGQSLADYDGISVSVNGELVMAALTFAESRDRNLVVLDEVLETQINDLYVRTAGQVTTFLLIPRARTREGSAAGQVNWQCTTRATHTFERFLHRTVYCHAAERSIAIGTAAQCLSACVPVGVAESGCACKVGPTTPMALVPPDLMGRSADGSPVAGASPMLPVNILRPAVRAY